MEIINGVDQDDICAGCDVVDDTSPQLGGNLDMGTYKLVGEGGSNGIYVDANGLVGIGTDNPEVQLHTTSGVRLAGLTENFDNTKMVVTDASGNLDYRSLQNPVSFSDAPFGQYVWYTPTFNNLLYAAEKRFTVTQTGFSTFDASGLFDNKYGNYPAIISSDDTEGTININIINKGEFAADGLYYSYGWIYVHFYFKYYTNSVKARLKTKNNDAAFEWRPYAAGTNISSHSDYRIMKIPMSNYFKCSDIEIVITSDTVNGSGTKQVRVAEIEFVLSDNVTDYAQPVISKRLDNSLFGDTKWKNSSNATKAQVTASTGNAQFLGGMDITGKLDVNNDTMRLRTVKTPATAGADGDQGDIAWDASYLYVCTATNQWKRAALSTW